MLNILICLMLIASITYSQTVIHVDDDNTTGPWHGTPEFPFQYIKDGITAASDGDIVLVHDGKYTGINNVDLQPKKPITIMSENGPATTIIDCVGTGKRAFTFINGEGPNTVVDGFTITNGEKTGNGGAIGCADTGKGPASPTIINNIITGNTAIPTGPDKDGQGGAIFCYGSSPTIAKNIIIGNQSRIGGAITCAGISVAKPSNPMIINNIIAGNVATNNGGGIACFQPGFPNIINNTITGNSASDNGGGIISYQGSSPKIIDSILWKNTASVGNEIAVEAAEITVSYSDVQGGKVGIGGTGKVIWGDGNIDADPLLYANRPVTDPLLYHLTDYSPCIGVGTSTPDITDDIDGDIRPWPAGSKPDMGADENDRGISLPRGDVSGNESVTAFDASLVLRHVVGLINLSGGQFPKGAADVGADVTGDKTVSALDAALILQYTVGLITKFPAENGAGAPILNAKSESKLLSDAISTLEKFSLDREQKEVVKSLKHLIVGSTLPTLTALLQNYPNPFNPETWLPYQLAQDAPVTILIYDAKGQLVRSLQLSMKQVGSYITKDRAAYWDGRDNLGQKVASGVYFYTLLAGKYVETRRMVILK